MGFAENGWVWAVGLGFGTQSGKKLDVRKGNMGMIMAFIPVASLYRSEKPLMLFMDYMDSRTWEVHFRAKFQVEFNSDLFHFDYSRSEIWSSLAQFYS